MDRKHGPPHPEEVAKVVAKMKNPIPVKYSNPTQSGLTADISPNNKTLHFDLED